jgi:hypothetical protein
MANNPTSPAVLTAHAANQSKQQFAQNDLPSPVLPQAGLGALPPHSDPESFLAYQAGQATHVRMQAGQHFKVRKLIRSGDSSALEAADNLIATRQGDDLHIRYADGGTVTLENCYGTCTNDAVCSVNLAADDSSGITLGADNAMGGTVSGDGGALVYAHGNHDVLMSMAQGQTGLVQSFAGLGEAPVLTYLPQSGHVVAALSSSFDAAAVLGGFAGLALAASGLSGATKSGSPATPSPSSIVQGSVQAGPVTTGNDLEVNLYGADGATLLKEHVALDSNGHFSTDVGSYTGVVFAKLVNKGNAADYLDEATNTAKDLTTPLVAMGVVTAPGTTLSLNLNVLSTIQGVNVIDMLTDQTADSLRLDLKQVLDLGSVNLVNSSTSGLTGGSYGFAANETRHQLLITGDAADQLATTGSFVDTGLTAIISGHTYEVYNQGNFAQLLVEQSINRTAVM